jgi:hypothetical protein
MMDLSAEYKKASKVEAGPKVGLNTRVAEQAPRSAKGEKE